jgi:RHH-type proline utilization regulon transcriptional repressor/proline dehydrogenase/delta 1-pyrroline-5-carboxylate dehydrogenase
VLFEGDSDALRLLGGRVAARPGPIVSVQGLSADAVAQGQSYVLDRLLAERSISVNTAAAGGNASLMTIG